MNKNSTSAKISGFKSLLLYQSTIRHIWSQTHYFIYMGLLIVYKLLFPLSLSGQELIPLDDYLSTMSKEPESINKVHTTNHETIQADFVKSQLFDLLSTAYVLDDEIKYHQTGRLVRMVTTLNNLASLPERLESNLAEFISIQTLLVKIKNAGDIESLIEMDPKLLDLLPSLRHVLFTLQFEPDEKVIHTLNKKLPKITTSKKSIERPSIIYFYKISRSS